MRGETDGGDLIRRRRRIVCVCAHLARARVRERSAPHHHPTTGESPFSPAVDTFPSKHGHPPIYYIYRKSNDIAPTFRRRSLAPHPHRHCRCAAVRATAPIRDLMSLATCITPHPPPLSSQPSIRTRPDVNLTFLLYPAVFPSLCPDQRYDNHWKHPNAFARAHL